jgi:hypothetical protein
LENIQFFFFFFFFDYENDFVVNEMYSFREFLKLSGDGQTSLGMKSKASCEINDSVEIE